MKKISLILMGAFVAFVGLQSFVQDNNEAEGTTLTTVEKSWSVDKNEGVLKPQWRISSCTTPEGQTGTICAPSTNNNLPACTPSPYVNVCNASSGS